MSAATWEPGDPLYAEGPYRAYFFNFKDDPRDEAEVCCCGDAAWWPEPASHSKLGVDPFEQVILAERAWRASA